MKFTYLNQRGSALIITMLVVAAISAAAFGISRIFLADIRITASLEDSLKSYYSAEAGIEEGLVRYRINRSDDALNNVTTPIGRPVGEQGSYAMTTSYLTTGDVSNLPGVDGLYAFDTIGEYPENPEFQGPPVGAVPTDETVEISIPTDETVTVYWRWEGGIGPGNRECGVEMTTVLPNGGFSKWLNRDVAPVNFQDIVYSGATSLRVKPLCRSLDWLAFRAQDPIGRTIQTIEATGFAGVAKRKLQAVVNRRSGSLVGLFDFVLGSEEDLIKPGSSSPPPPPPPSTSQPDLIVTSITNPLVVEGNTGQFSGIVRNQGSSDAASFSIRYHLDLGANGTYDQAIGTRTVSSLAAGAQTTVLSNIVTAVLGTHIVRLCADAQNTIEESNETNNCTTLTFTVRTGTPEGPGG